MKILELESQLDKSKHSTITADTLVTPSSILEQQIKTLENEKLELKLQLQQVDANFFSPFLLNLIFIFVQKRINICITKKSLN